MDRLGGWRPRQTGWADVAALCGYGAPVTLSPSLERSLVLHAGVHAGTPVDVQQLVGEAALLDEAGHVTVLKDAARSRVLAAEVGGEHIVLKVTPSPDPLRRVFEAMGLFLAKPRRHVRGAELLTRAGIPTAPVLALVRGRNTHGRLVDTLVMTRLAGRDALTAYRDAQAPERRAIAASVGRLTYMLRRAGLTNRDHKPSNIIVIDDAQPGCDARVALIDVVGVRSGRANTPRLLFNLLVECVGTGVHIALTDRLRALTYATGMRTTSGADCRTTRRKRGDRTARNIIWRLAAKRLADHHDPAPLDSPLPLETGG